MNHFRLCALCGSLLAMSSVGCEIDTKVATVAELHQAVRAARSGEVIVIARGTYRLRRPLRMMVPDVTLCGATGDRDEVVLVGGGMNVPARAREGIMIEADDITIRDLTIRDFYKHGLHIRAESDADRTVISNVKTVNIGERHVKGSRGQGNFWADDVVIERLHMLQTEKRKRRPGHPISPDNYIGGIDAMAARNWIVRDCLAEGIRGATGGGNAAIFIWNGVENVLIERNRIIRCCKGIALGNPSGPKLGPHHAVGGIIRNNFILRSRGRRPNNIGIELCNVRDVKVMHNTIYSEDPSYARAVHLFDQPGEGLIENVTIGYNIIRGRIADNTVSGLWGESPTRRWRAVGNVHGWKERGRGEWKGTPVEAGWFVDAAAGDLHLTPKAAAAIDSARRTPDVTDDIDRRRRPAGKAPDAGADEYRPDGR